MLVLSRKIDQQIMIGDDITLTIVRIDQNRVRVGISAPRDVRILRGELTAKDSACETAEFELSDREFAFAHQSDHSKNSNRQQRLLDATEPQVFSGTVAGDGSKVKLNVPSSDQAKSAPLASFVSAS